MKMVKATEEDVSEGLNGGCVSCGEIQYGGCEPDARKYECNNCGKKTVYGLEELVMMGQLHLLMDDEEKEDGDD